MCLFVSVCYFVFDIFALKKNDLIHSRSLLYIYIYSSPRPETRETDLKKEKEGRREEEEEGVR